MTPTELYTLSIINLKRLTLDLYHQKELELNDKNCSAKIKNKIKLLENEGEKSEAVKGIGVKNYVCLNPTIFCSIF